MFQHDSSLVVFRHAADSSTTFIGKKSVLQKADLKKDLLNTVTDSSGHLKSYAPSLQTGTDSLHNDSSVIHYQTKKEFRFSDIDTIRAESYEPTVNAGPKIFSGHLLEPVHRSPQSYNKPNPDWFTVILFMIVFGFMWIRVFYYKILRQIVNAFFNNSVSNQIVRDENMLIQRASVMLSIMFYLVSALFLYQVSVAFEWQNRWLTNGFSRLIVFAFFIAFAYSAKMILLKLIGYILDIDKSVATYIFNIFLMNNILGIVLLPLVIIIAYVSTPFTYFIFWTAIGIIAGTFIYRLIRGISIGMKIPKFSVFYLFLYLCAFEIAPLALIYKLAAI
jgi:hypothetical protein